MNQSSKKSFITDYQSAIKQPNKEEAVKKVYAKYEEFLLSLSVLEALNLGVEMGLWSKKVAAQSD